MNSAFDDLLGSGSPGQPVRIGKKRGRKSAAELAEIDRAAREDGAMEAARQQALNLAKSGRFAIDEREFFVPVGTNFLHRVLRMDVQTIRTRLRTLEPIGYRAKDQPLWDFHATLPYLVKPKMTADQFARTLNRADLPPEINKSFWDSQRSRIRYKIEAQEAWETEDVMMALGSVAMLLKDSLTMVVEDMRSKAKLSDEQTEVLSACIDELRTEIRRQLVDVPARTHTPSMFGRPLFGISTDIDTQPDVQPDGGWYDADEGEGDE